VLPLLAMPLAGRAIEEPARFARTVRGRLGPRLTRLRRTRLEVRRRLALVAVPFFAISLVTGPANTFLFLYAENVLGMATTTTTLAVVSSGPVGLLGLLVGRAAADRVGRLPTAATAHVAVCLAALIMYSGRPWAVIAGYLLTIGAGGALAPAFGAVSTELFPTSVRGTVAGAIAACGVIGATLGLVVYGVLLTVTGSFLTATLVVVVPAAAAAAVFLRLPETMGLELEESAPE
jgi:MFS family permease